MKPSRPRFQIVSDRWTPCHGKIVQVERDCTPEEAEAWLAIFQSDEPRVAFRIQVQQ